MIHDFRRLNPWRYVGRAYDPHRLWVRRIGYPHPIRFRR